MADPAAADVPPDRSPDRSPEPNGHSRPAEANGGEAPGPPGEHGGLDVEAIGVQMSDQFLEMLGLWTQQMTALAEAGIDPSPMVLALARTLRSAADQLDPHGAGAGG